MPLPSRALADHRRRDSPGGGCAPRRPAASRRRSLRSMSRLVLLAAALALPAAHAAPVPKLAGCVPGATPTVRPKEVIVACGDANFYFTNLRWSAWNATRAV